MSLERVSPSAILAESGWVTIGLAPDGFPAEMLPDCKIIGCPPGRPDKGGVLIARPSAAMLATGFLNGWIAARNTPQEDYYEDDARHIDEAIRTAIKYGVARRFARKIGRTVDRSTTTQRAVEIILSSWEMLKGSSVTT